MRIQLILGIAICILAGLLSVLLGPDRNWDLWNYHLYAPYAYLHSRYLYDIGPGQVQSFLNPAASFILYALTSTFLNEFPRVVAFIMGALHGINAVIIMLIAQHVLRPIGFSERFALQLIAL